MKKSQGIAVLSVVTVLSVSALAFVTWLATPYTEPESQLSPQMQLLRRQSSDIADLMTCQQELGVTSKECKIPSSLAIYEDANGAMPFLDAYTEQELEKANND